MNDILNQTLAQIVTSNHSAASVFEKYGLDFCCNGKRSLLRACEEKKLPVEQVSAELTNIFNSKNNTGAVWSYLKPGQLCDYIVDTHHAYLRESIPQIEAYLEKIATKHGKTYPHIKEVLELFRELRKDLEEHMLKEEKILFPRIKEMEHAVSTNIARNREENFIKVPVSVLKDEHEQAGYLLSVIRAKTNGYTPPAGACTTHVMTIASLKTFEADLHQHVHLENNILFPQAIALMQQLHN